MAKSKIKVIGAIIILVIAVLFILLFGYAFSGEETMRTTDEAVQKPYVFVNRLFQNEINQPTTTTNNLYTESCGNVDTFINYHDVEPSKPEVIYLDGFYHEPSCDCDTPNLFVNYDSKPKQKPEKKYYEMNYFEPTCTESFDTFVKRNNYDVKSSNVKELTNFYYVQSCN